MNIKKYTINNFSHNINKLNSSVYFNNKIEGQTLNNLVILRMVGASLSIFVSIFLIFLYILLYYKTRWKKRRKIDFLDSLIKEQNLKTNYNNSLTDINGKYGTDDKYNEIDNTYNYDDLSSQNQLEESLNRTNTLRFNKLNINGNSLDSTELQCNITHNYNNIKRTYKIGLGNDLLLFYSISCILNSTAFLIKTSYTKDEIQGLYTSVSCIAQSFLLGFGNISVYAWIACISHSFLISSKLTNFSQIKKLRIIYIVYSTVIPLVFSLLPLFLGIYGYSSSYCYFNLNNVCFKTKIFIWLILMYNMFNFIFQFVCTLVTASYFNKRFAEIKNDLNKNNEVLFIKQYRVLIWVVTFIIFLSHIPLIINGFSNVLQDYYEYMSVYYNISLSFFGFFLGICYCFYYRQLFHIVFPCIKFSSQNCYSKTDNNESKFFNTNNLIDNNNCYYDKSNDNVNTSNNNINNFDNIQDKINSKNRIVSKIFHNKIRTFEKNINNSKIIY